MGSLHNNNPLDIDYKLDKIDAVIKKISNDYGNEATLNINLVDKLFSNNDSLAIRELLQQFKNNTTRTNNFIEMYVLNGKHISKFVKETCNHFDDFWDYILNSNLTDDKKDFILKEILLNANVNDIFKLDSNNFLSDFISEKKDFLNLIDKNSKNVQDALLKLNVKFKYPLDSQVNKKLFDFIYDNNLYEINFEMIQQMIVEMTKEDFLVSDLKKSNYTLVLNSKCDSLIKYIKKNLSYYLNNVFLKIETNKFESEANIIDLLNEKIDDNIKLLVIEKQDFKVSNILDVDSEFLWIELINKNKVKSTWENIINYCSNESLDEYIVGFLNKQENFLELSNLDINEVLLDEEDRRVFIHNLVCANDLTKEAYEILLQEINESIDDIKIETLEESKIKLLIEKGIISFKKENFESLRKNSLDKQILLIELNFQAYLEQRDDEELDSDEKVILETDELQKLIISETLGIECKVELIDEISVSQIEENNRLGQAISVVLVNYGRINISYEFLLSLLKCSNNEDINIKLSNRYCNLFLGDNSKVENVLTAIGMPFSAIPIGGIKPPIISNDSNLFFIENLKTSHYIESYSNNNGFITKIRKN